MSFAKAAMLVVKILLPSVLGVLALGTPPTYPVPLGDGEGKSGHKKDAVVNRFPYVDNHNYDRSIFLKDVHFVPLKGFGPIFEKSLLVFRGATQIFDFREIQLLGVPLVHIVTTQYSSKKATFSHIDPKTFSRSVWHQVTVLAEDDTSPWTSNFEFRKWYTIPVHPQTLLVMSTSKNHEEIFNVPGQVRLRESNMYELPRIAAAFNYDISTRRPLDAHVLCSICQFRREVELLQNEEARLGTMLVPSLGYVWDVNNAAAELAEKRANITGNGRHILWHPELKGNHETEIQLIVSIRLDEFSRNGTTNENSPVWILGLENVQVAMIKLLFPIVRGTFTPIDSRIVSDCFQSNDTAPPFCTNRGLAAGFYRNLENMPSLLITLNRDTYESVVFITAEKVHVSQGPSALNNLNIFGVSIWILLGVAVFMTAALFTVMYPPLETDTVSMSRAEGSRFTATIVYLCLAFVGQFPRDLPFKAPIAKDNATTNDQIRFSKNAGNLLLCLIPWILGTTLLSSWYTAFLSSSFNFPFAYELDLQDWRDLENFSVYIIRNKYTFWCKRKPTQLSVSLQGEWKTAEDLQYLVKDVENFPNISEFHNFVRTQLEPGSHWPPSGLDMHFYRRKMFLKQSHQAKENNYHALGWFSEHLLNFSTCISDVTLDQGTRSACAKDRDVLEKMIYRLDSIDPTELSWYVGAHYKNLTEQGRKIGLELIRTMGNATLERDDLGLSRWKNSVVRIGNKVDKNTFYWMTRRPEAVFVVTKSDFPWCWNLFKKLMRKDTSLKFAHTGSQELKSKRMGDGLGGNGFESPLSISGPRTEHLPEFEWMMRRIRALQHSGILGYLAKWDQIVHPPSFESPKEFVVESDTGFQQLTMQHDLVHTAFTIFMVAMLVAVIAILAEVAYAAFFNLTQ